MCPQLLSEQLVEQLNLGQEQCMSALRELQAHSIKSLKAKQTFQDTGVASLRVKVSGEHRTTLSININLASNARQLVEDISNQVNVPVER